MTTFQKVHALLFHILILISLLPPESLVKWKNSLSPPLPPTLNSSWSLTNLGHFCNWDATVCDNTSEYKNLIWFDTFCLRLQNRFKSISLSQK